MKNVLSLLLVIAGLLGGALATEPPHVVHQLDVYREDNRFAGWPANHGMWSWGDEIVFGFESGYFKKNARGHAIDYSKPAEHFLARSMDGGETWSIERPQSLTPPPGIKMAGVPTQGRGKAVMDSPPGKIDFSAPGFALTARMESIHTGPSWFYYTYDRGKSWEGPYLIPDFGQPGIAARTDYIVNDKHDMTMFLTAAKSNGKEGRVICVRTKDGGKTWKLISLVGPEPSGKGYAIMPSSIRLGESEILTTIRRRRWIEAFRSRDDGQTWELVNQPAPRTGGNPPSLIQLRDGRLVVTYGFRAESPGIRARVSKNLGNTWGEEFVLRSDGGSWDLGYPRTVQRSDGKLLTVYYFNQDRNDVRYIGATIWNPGRE
jgi:hypothetical protein